MVDTYNCCGMKVWFPHIKSHYFLLNAALCGVIPFLHVYGQQLGVSAVAVGIIFAILPFLTMIAKPFVGWIADFTKCLKIILYVLLCALSVSCIFLTLIPRKDHSVSGHIVCNSQGTTFSYANQTDLSCIENIPENEDYYCFMTCEDCSSAKQSPAVYENFINQSSCRDSQSMSAHMTLHYNKSYPVGTFIVSSFNLQSRNLNSICVRNLYFSCDTTCAPTVHDCYDSEKDSGPGVLQLSVYVLLVVVINISSGISATLGDAACFNILGDRAYLYGRQRLWGTIGWGLFSPLVGFVNNAITGPQFIQSYFAGFLSVPFLLFLDILVLKNVEVESINISKSIWKDVGKLLRKVDVVVFIISVFMFGSLSGVLWTFLYWHLSTLNASVFLLGLVPAVECLLGELPFFFFASKIIAKIGHFNAMTICLLSFGLRLLCISYLKDPWWILLIGLLQGPTFGIFYTTMATYANIAALPGTETTMQGLVGGVFEGLGIAAGSLVGGVAMEKYKGSVLFFGACIIAFCYAGVNMIFTACLRISKKRAERNIRIVHVPNEETNFI